MKKKVNRSQLAEQYFLKGYSCSQAVVLAYKDLIKLDEKTILKIASPFGGGMGRLREVCGAFSGALIVLGYLKGNDTIDANKKMMLYQDIQKMAKDFEKENGQNFYINATLSVDTYNWERAFLQRFLCVYQHAPCNVIS